MHRIIRADLHKNFKKHKETLQIINKALEAYLEQKRKLFPRFYFLSNDDLLDILANSQDTLIIQKHTKKMFEAVFRLFFKDTDDDGNPLMEDINYQIINGVISQEGELVEFKMVTVRSEIEDSMLQIEDHLDE